jgi:hypothetical protein
MVQRSSRSAESSELAGTENCVRIVSIGSLESHPPEEAPPNSPAMADAVHGNNKVEQESPSLRRIEHNTKKLMPVSKEAFARGEAGPTH